MFDGRGLAARRYAARADRRRGSRRLLDSSDGARYAAFVAHFVDPLGPCTQVDLADGVPQDWELGVPFLPAMDEVRVTTGPARPARLAGGGAGRGLDRHGAVEGVPHHPRPTGSTGGDRLRSAAAGDAARGRPDAAPAAQPRRSRRPAVVRRPTVPPRRGLRGDPPPDRPALRRRVDRRRPRPDVRHQLARAVGGGERRHRAGAGRRHDHRAHGHRGTRRRRRPPRAAPRRRRRRPGVGVEPPRRARPGERPAAGRHVTDRPQAAGRPAGRGERRRQPATDAHAAGAAGRRDGWTGGRVRHRAARRLRRRRAPRRCRAGVARRAPTAHPVGAGRAATGRGHGVGDRPPPRSRAQRTGRADRHGGRPRPPGHGRPLGGDRARGRGAADRATRRSPSSRSPSTWPPTPPPSWRSTCAPTSTACPARCWPVPSHASTRARDR